MVLFLTAPWFDRLRRDTETLRRDTETLGAPVPGFAETAPGSAETAPGLAETAPGLAETAPGLVLRHRVRPPGGGGGDADYDVVIDGGRAVIRHPVAGPADLTFTSDYPTAAAIAAGTLSTRAALAEGRLRVSGDVGILSRRASDVAGLDPVPAGLRAETEF
jgi:hypothetical protein